MSLLIGGADTNSNGNDAIAAYAYVFSQHFVLRINNTCCHCLILLIDENKHSLFLLCHDTVIIIIEFYWNQLYNINSTNIKYFEFALSKVIC